MNARLGVFCEERGDLNNGAARKTYTITEESE